MILRQCCLFFLMLVFSQELIYAQGSKKKSNFVSVSGLVTQTSSWCGGMKPSDEVLKDKKTPKPLAGKVLYIKIGKENTEAKPVYKKVVSDEQGRFTVKLKTGVSYIFLEEWKAIPFKVPENTELITYDAACFEKQYARPDFALTVKRSKNEVQINFHEPCAHKPMCGTYHGKLPE